jgi:hypothetical protein
MIPKDSLEALLFVALYGMMMAATLATILFHIIR